MIDLTNNTKQLHKKIKLINNEENDNIRSAYINIYYNRLSLLENEINIEEYKKMYIKYKNEIIKEVGIYNMKHITEVLRCATNDYIDNKKIERARNKLEDIIYSIGYDNIECLIKEIMWKAMNY